MFITIKTPLGPLTMVGRGETVLAAGFTDRVDELVGLIHPELREPADADLTQTVKATLAYFDGDLTAIDRVPVEQRTTGGFLGHAWDVLREVPAGAPVTPAIRAAAQACARNAAALFVPCHRVVRTDGTLGGYRWGLDVKRWLLNHESQMKETGS
jgi:methylated-DNA-[protein]-cysteine S-methyltransferase